MLRVGLAMVVSVFSLSSTHALATLYNGAPNLSVPYLAKHEDIKMRELWPPVPWWPNYAVIDEAHVRAFVAQLPNDRTYMFDLEGRPDKVSDGRNLWHYESSPVTAVQFRQNMMYIIADERPDLDIGIWSIPDEYPVRSAILQPNSLENALELGERQWEYRGVVAFTDTNYVSAYWNYRPDEVDKLPEWKARIRMKIALSEVFYKQLPVVYFSHKSYVTGTPLLLSEDLFAETLQFISSQCVDAVFWTMQDEVDIPEWVQTQLWEEAWKQWQNDPCSTRGN